MAAVTKDNALAALKDLFLERVKREDGNDWQMTDKGVPQYYRMVDTSRLATRLDLSNAQTRRLMNRLENDGAVKSKRHPNWIVWTAVEYQGFKDTQFADYLQRTDDNPKPEKA
jgi:hypothetical protein